MLITTTDVLSTAFADSGFYAPYINNSLIETAQQDWLRPAVGKEYYMELLAEKTSGFSAANQYVYDTYVIPALCWYTAYLAVPFASNKLSSLGVIDKFLEYREPASTGMGEAAREAYHAIAVSYRDALIGYITDEDNSAQFPAYNNNVPCLPVQMIGGLALDGRKAI